MRRISANLPDNFVYDSEEKQQESASDSQDLVQAAENLLPISNAEDTERAIMGNSQSGESSSSLPSDEAGKSSFSPYVSPSIQFDAKTERKKIRSFILNPPRIDEEFIGTKRERESVKSNLSGLGGEYQTDANTAPPAGEAEQRTISKMKLNSVPAEESTYISEHKGEIASETESGCEMEEASEIEQEYVIPRLPRAQLIYPGFQNAMEFLRENFQLPREIQLNQQKSSRTWLLLNLKKIDSIEEMAAFAYSLSRKDQALLFPVLATLKKKADIEKLEEVILLLNSKSLYIHGWLTLQFAYPRSTVATTLTKLCLKLEERNFSDRNYSAQEFHRSQRHASGRSESEIVWSKISPITEISHPNSRHFISDIVDYYFDSGLDYPEFCRRYAIYTDLRLGIAISENIEDKIIKEGASFHHSKRFFSQD